jgi:tetratricopeptide (TPR) repeat protein
LPILPFKLRVNIHDNPIYHSTMSREADIVAQGQSVVEKLLRDRGPDDTNTLEAQSGLGRALHLNQQFSESNSVLREVLGRQRSCFGDSDPGVLRTEVYLAALLYHQHQYEEGIELLYHVINTSTDALGDDDAWPLNPALFDLARALTAVGRFEEEIPIRRRVLASCCRLLNPRDRRILEAESDLASALRSSGHFDDAHEMDRDLLSQLHELPDRRSLYLGTQFNLAVDLIGMGRTEEGERLGYQTFISIVEELPQSDPIRQRVEPFAKEFKLYGKRSRRNKFKGSSRHR